MKKLLVISLLLLVVVSCMKDEILEPINMVEVPQSLKIDDIQGLKLESSIVSEEVSMNVKLPYPGTYRIKIKDFGNELISQEKITADGGDNILKVYVSSLPSDSYTIELSNEDGNVLGKSTFVVQN